MFETFEAAESYYYGLWYAEQADFEQALKIALWCYETYPEHKKQLMLDLGLLYAKVGRKEESIKILNKALDQGVWYPKAYLSEFWPEDWFQPIVKRWGELRSQDLKQASVQYDLLTPETFMRDKPLFIALHGWGEDIRLFKQFWQSDLLKNAFNTVYVQSSQMIGAYHYRWSDYEQAKKDIDQVLEALKTRYNVYADDIYVGGFSEGATTSLRLTMEDNNFDIKGFIALNPNKPEEVTLNNINRLKALDVSGAIITGDQDQCYGEQEDMKHLFDTEGFLCDWIVTENFGHWFPKDLDEKLDCVLKRFID